MVIVVGCYFGTSSNKKIFKISKEYRYSEPVNWGRTDNTMA